MTDPLTDVLSERISISPSEGQIRGLLLVAFTFIGVVYVVKKLLDKLES